MYVQGVSTRKIKTITEELCGHEFSASAISEMNVKLDGELERFARRALEVEFPYLILDARYEQVREEGVIRSRAVLVVIGIDWEGRRQILAVEIANRESTTSWRDLLLSLKQRGLSGVRLAISDDHAGLKRALAEVLPEACWQRYSNSPSNTQKLHPFQPAFAELDAHNPAWRRRGDDGCGDGKVRAGGRGRGTGW